MAVARDPARSQRSVEAAEKKLLEVKNLSRHFRVKGGVLKAVNDVSFDVRRGEVLGLVGESGCGKSTVGRTLLGLYPATSGQILYDGMDITRLKGRDAKEMKRKMQMIFQDPYASLDPRMTVLDIIGEALEIHGMRRGKAMKARVQELLEVVGLNREHASRFPHEFSGGQRQRIGIARALAVEPEFIVADEPISALDVSIQAQVVNLLNRLKTERNLTYIFIAHDLSMVKHISDRVAVMYLGKMVEVADSDELYTNAVHPYTQGLLSAIPIPDPKVEKKRERIVMKGEVPSPINPPSGCFFRTRCPFAQAKCAEETPEWREVRPGHWAACHFVEDGVGPGGKGEANRNAV